MKLDRDAMWNTLFVAALLAFGAWVVCNTEWADEVVQDPAKGEAAKDNHYAIKQIVQRLGGKVVSPPNLDRLPPTNATLVLNSWGWDLLPQREKTLRQWIESGGHLVTEQWNRAEWLGVQSQSTVRPRTPQPQASKPASAPSADDDEEDEKPAGDRARAAGDVSKRTIAPPGPAACFDVIELESAPPAFETHRSFRLCGWRDFSLQAKTPVIWSLEGFNGPNVLRTRIGRGAVTVVVGPRSDNSHLFDADHAPAFVAALDLQHRREVWFVDTEARDPLLKLIWRHGKPAVLLGAILLALALWRAAIRFGPGGPVTPVSRRSVAEQIRGTSSFIFRRDSSALHKAQLRALEQTARRSIRDHDRMDLRSRAEAIARATALDADALARAMDLTLERPRRDLPATLTLLETAVRRLAKKH